MSNIKQVKLELKQQINNAIDALEALERNSQKFADKAIDEIEDAAIEINETVHEYEKPVDNVLTVAVDSPHTAWLVIAALTLSMGAGAFLYSLFC